jgi:hypothetical protein
VVVVSVVDRVQFLHLWRVLGFGDFHKQFISRETFYFILYFFVVVHCRFLLSVTRWVCSLYLDHLLPVSCRTLFHQSSEFGFLELFFFPWCVQCTLRPHLWVCMSVANCDWTYYCNFFIFL